MRAVVTARPAACFRGGTDLAPYRGNEEFRFVDISNVSRFAYGRLEDFQLGEDKIFVEGEEIDMANMTSAGQTLSDGTHVQVVLYQGAHDDPGADPQFYLHINVAGGGIIFYALEGARVDMVGVAPGFGDQEAHFLNYATRPDWKSLVAVDYEDPQDYIPNEYLDDVISGSKIIDYDLVRQDVLNPVVGTSKDDHIAAGLNDDTVFGGAGHDTIWGGSGHDVVHGDSGNDVIFGGRGDDLIFGGGNGDILHGGSGDDEIHTGWGWDVAYGEAGNDRLVGGGGKDVLDGGTGRDTLYGGSGNDEFVFRDFDVGFDLVEDFTNGQDKIRFSGEVNDYGDLIFWDYVYEGTLSTLIRFRDSSGSLDKTMGGVVLEGVSISELDASDFVFG